MAKRLTLPALDAERRSTPLAARVGDLLFTGAIAGRDPATGQLAADPERQAELAFQNARAVLQRAGLGDDAVGHVFVWLADGKHQAAVDRAWAKTFADPRNRPAYHAVVRPPLQDQGVLEVEVIAAAGGQGRTNHEIPGVSGSNGGPMAAQVGSVLFSSGIIGRDPSTGKMGDTPERQAELVFQNIGDLLQTAGFSPEDVAHIFIWIKDRRYQDTVNGPYAQMFPDKASRPSRHAVVVELPDDTMMRLEIVAVRGGKRESVNVPGVSHTTAGGNNFLPFATKVGNTLFSSGMMGRDPADGAVAKTPERQTELCFQHMLTVLQGGGFIPDDIGHIYVWYRDPEHRTLADAPFLKMFPDPDNRPVLHALAAELPNEMVVQLEIVAAR